MLKLLHNMSKEDDEIKKVANEIQHECNHELDPPKFIESDLNVCEPTVTPEIEEYQINLNDFNDELLKSMGIELDDSTLNGCINLLRDCIAKLNILLNIQLELQKKINPTRENYWIKNLIYTYYKNKSDVYSRYYQDFQPLVESKDSLEKEIKRLKGILALTLFPSDNQRNEIKLKEKELDNVNYEINSIRGQEAILKNSSNGTDSLSPLGQAIVTNPQISLQNYINEINKGIYNFSDLLDLSMNIVLSQSVNFQGTILFNTKVGQLINSTDGYPLKGALRTYYNEERRIPSEEERKDLDFIKKRNDKLNSIMNNQVVPSYDTALNTMLLGAKNISLGIIVELKNWDIVNETQDFIKSQLQKDSLQYKKEKDIAEQNWKQLQQDIKNNQQEIDNLINEIQTISCFQKTDTVKPTIEPGSDFSLKISDPKQPTLVNLEYWNKFCLEATKIGLLPSYWATGLLIPNPSGLTPVLFPIIFKPIAVIPTPIGLFVFIIGQRGILPCPILLYIGPGIESTFLLGVRSSNLKIYSSPGSPPTTKLSPPAINALFEVNPPISNKIPQATGPGFDTPKFPPISLNPITTAAQELLSPVLGMKFRGGDLTKIFNSIPNFYIQDDLPPWERLNVIKNLPWVKYLNNWCLQAKINSGFPGYP